MRLHSLLRPLLLFRRPAREEEKCVSHPSLDFFARPLCLSLRARDGSFVRECKSIDALYYFWVRVIDDDAKSFLRLGGRGARRRIIIGHPFTPARSLSSLSSSSSADDDDDDASRGTLLKEEESSFKIFVRAFYLGF